MDAAILQSLLPHLVPLPGRIEARPGRLVLPLEPLWTGEREVPAATLGRLGAVLASRRHRCAGRAALDFVLDPGSNAEPEGYALEVAPERARVVAATRAGLAHGTRTLTQLVRAATAGDGTTAASLPALWIEDEPTFGRRGVMLDVSRDRVPRMDSLFALVERLGEWKLNELQLYFEHTFAYAGHEIVWRAADPFTPDEVRALDRHCIAHGIELVPNQQSFGHLHHWLKHEPYRHLAELPEGILHPFLVAGGQTPEPFSLCPTDPRSLDFLAGLYDQLLPCFSSAECNVGLDETIDLGPGRSAGTIRARGVGRVYVDFLKQVHGLIRARGRRMQFWADIVLHHEELVPEIPDDAIACLWGYEADHPFERETGILARAGRPFVVCPGTSSWQSIGGRLANMVDNVAAAAHWGARRGARGLLVTDWGDRGHLQPPSVGLPGFLAAAEASWNPRPPDDARLAKVLEAVLGHAGTRLHQLGHAADPCPVTVRNASVLSLLLTRFDAPFPPADGLELTREALEAIAHQREAGRSPDSGAPGSTVDREIAWANDLLAFSAHLGLARLEAGDGRPLAALTGSARTTLGAELAPLIERHRSLWAETSRPGGLERSARWLERPLAALRQA